MRTDLSGWVTSPILSNKLIVSIKFLAHCSKSEPCRSESSIKMTVRWHRSLKVGNTGLRNLVNFLGQIAGPFWKHVVT